MIVPNGAHVFEQGSEPRKIHFVISKLLDISIDFFGGNVILELLLMRYCTRRTSSRGDCEMGSVGVCGGVCGYNNIVNPAGKWPPLLHTLTDRD